jgi:hypothetical protein
MTKPRTFQRDLAKLPPALTPLIERAQWCVWRWTQLPNGKWQKPPFMATQPDRHASTNDPATWSDYATALATVEAGQADGISYVLTEDDQFAAVDLDGCCDPIFGTSVDIWAQNWLDTGRHTYQELTPSGTGIHIWGLATGDRQHRKFTLEIDGKQVAAELFRRTNKALTITGYTLDPAIRELTSIDRVINWGLVWGERRKAAAEAAKPHVNGGNGFDSGGCKYSIDEIEQIVRDGVADGGNRSDTFHSVIGHYTGCEWSVGQIWEHLDQHPSGIGERYQAENRLDLEVSRSYRKWAELPALSPSELAKWTQEWKNELEAKAPPQPEPADPGPVDAGLEDDQPGNDELGGDQDDDPQLDDDELENDELDDDEQPQRDPGLPQMHRHGDPDPRPLKSWLIKHLMSTTAHGLLSGQWGTGKTFIVFDLFAALMTGQPFLGHAVKRQCGVLLLAAEGADEIRLRLDAVVREKCGGMQRAPFCWYEDVPPLLAKGSVEKLIAMARQAQADIEDEFGLPLGLIVVDTVTAGAGYSQQGAENDNAVGQAVMNTLKAIARVVGCAVVGVDHLGKDITRGSRGAGSKDGSGDVVWFCLGDRQLSGAVSNTRLAIHKHRGGRAGAEHPYVLREVAAPELDEDGEPVTTMVVDWQPAPAAGTASPPKNEWIENCPRQDQQAPMVRLQRVLMAELAEHGEDLPIPPDGPVVRMIDQKLIRERFYAQTLIEETEKQTRHARYKQFKAATQRAEIEQRIGVGTIGETTYIWLMRPKSDEADGES